MTTDLYAKCPCGSGKKIKFCCKDIISDIKRIERMLQGEQRTAALDKVNKLLEKHVDRPALLSLKGMVQLELDQLDEASQAIDRLLQLEPEHPAGLAMKATLQAIEGHFTGSLRELHRALRFSDGVMLQPVYRSYLSVCLNLMQRNELIAAYAHLLTLVSITKGQDRASVTMLMNVSSSERLPAIFQGLMVETNAPEDVTWNREFEVAIEMYRHGDWSEAASMFDSMSARILDEPILLRNQAILQAWTCQNEKAIKSFRDFAAIRGVDLQDAAEAEACAQVLEEAPESDTDKMVSISHDIENADTTMEKLLSSPDVESIPVQRDPESDAPPPKGRFVVFDRPIPEREAEDADVTMDDLPKEICSIMLFGKETDRSARLVVVGFQDEHLEEIIRKVSGIADEPISMTDQLETIGAVHKVERMFRPAFRVPPKASLTIFSSLQQQWAAKQLNESWPELELSQFGGKTARQAATEKKLQQKVLAAILNLEIWADRQPFEFDFDQLRASLGLPASEKIDPNEVDLRSLSPTKLRCVLLEKLTDEDLKFVFEVTSVRPNGALLYRIGEEILKRPTMVDQLDLVEVHERMADVAPSTDQQLEHLRSARDLSVSKGESPASWLVAELDLRIQRGEVEIAKRLVLEIQSRYLKEPGIGQMFAQVLSKYGLMPASPGAPAGVPSDAVDALPATASSSHAAPVGAVWTPNSDDDASAPAQGHSEEKSKLWVPGMD